MLLDKLLSNLDIHVEQFSLCQVTPGKRLYVPDSSRVMLHFILAGSGFLRSANEAVHGLKPCSLAIVPRGVHHSLEPKGEIVKECEVDVDSKDGGTARDSKEPPEVVVACGLVRVRYGAALGLFDKLDDVLVEDLSDIPRVQAAFREILSEQSDAGPGSDAMKAALMSQCIVHLFRRLCESGDCSFPWLAALQDEGLAQALDHILHNPGDLHTVESLAEVASMSRSTFAETFAVAFGIPPMSMVRRIRLERAWKLLEQRHEMPIETVARRVGFSSRSHFSRAFKRHFGVSPLTLRAIPS
jgi:AraC-like DNA-binding protein